MSWSLVTNEWRLKGLALILAVLMLGAVALSQNPPTVRTLTVGLSYTVPPNIVLINPPAKTTVTVRGLADVISKVDSSNLIATADATGVLPGAAVKLNITAQPPPTLDVRVENPPPIVVTVDTYQALDLPVVVNARAANGWSIDPSKTLATCPGTPSPSPCKVHFAGPVSWETNIKAVATFPGSVIGKSDSLNQPVTLQNASGALDLSVRTVPGASLDVTTVNLHAESVAGTTSASVPLIDSTPSKPPPAGYRVTGVTITPLIVTISGDAAVLQRVRNITLPAVDLSKSTSDTTFELPINYPTGVTGSVTTATVRYTIARNPNVSPSP
jgi:YbbR domain-containing protein